MFDYNDNNHKYGTGYAGDGSKVDPTKGITKGSNQPLAYPQQA